MLPLFHREMCVCVWFLWKWSQRPAFKNASGVLLAGQGGKHKSRGPSPALHLVLSGPAPCFYLAAAQSSFSLVKE